MNTVLDILVAYRTAFLAGLVTTLSLAGVVWLVGICLGTVLAVIADGERTIVRPICSATAFLFASVPLLVFLYWMHFPLQAWLNIVIPPFYTAAFALSLLNTAGVYGLISHALSEIPAQYTMAGRVCGLTSREIVRHIKAPLVIRHALPGVLTLQVFILQSTVFASLISVDELFRVAQRINAQVYKPIQIYTAMAVFFILLCAPILFVSWRLRRVFSRDLSER